jgi:hypothetical protein
MLTRSVTQTAIFQHNSQSLPSHCTDFVWN